MHWFLWSFYVWGNSYPERRMMCPFLLRHLLMQQDAHSMGPPRGPGLDEHVAQRGNDAPQSFPWRAEESPGRNLTPCKGGTKHCKLTQEPLLHPQRGEASICTPSSDRAVPTKSLQALKLLIDCGPQGMEALQDLPLGILGIKSSGFCVAGLSKRWVGGGLQGILWYFTSSGSSVLRYSQRQPTYVAPA